jgi:hypothetical protein
MVTLPSNAPRQPPLQEADPFLPDGRLAEPPLWIEEGRPWNQALAEHYLGRYSASGDLVLDPFAVQGALPGAVAATQRRAVLSHYSPATIVALRTSAAAPSPGVLDAAFSALADAPRRGRTLADYIRSLYESFCPECARPLQAAYFVWDQAAGEPVEKGYTCPHCRGAGQARVDLADGDLAAGLEMRGAAYWGLLSRLVAPGDPLTADARRLLELYSPRALIAISELLTAAEQRLDDQEERYAALAMILHALQRCISLYGQPLALETPLAPHLAGQLHPPARFVEHNVWQAFEHAYQVLRGRQPQPLRRAHDMAALMGEAGRGSTLFLSVPVQALSQQLAAGSAALILTDPPPLSPAAYALSFLWSGWLFGRKAADQLRAMLEVRNVTWDWYCRVMVVALRSLRRLLRPDGTVVLAFGGRSTRWPLALIAAASQAGLALVAQATQAPLVAGDDRTTWRLTFARDERLRQSINVPALPYRLRQLAAEATDDLIHLRAEPVPLSLVHTAVAARWEAEGCLAALASSDETAAGPVTYLSQQLRQALAPDMPPPGLRHVAGQNHETAAQWAPELALPELPLVDRVESRVVELLAQGGQLAERLATEVYASFPGFETPDAQLIAACLESYGIEEQGVIRLRPEDSPAHRPRERGELLMRLYDLGHRLGYQVWVASTEQADALGLVPIGRGGPADEGAWAPAGLVWHEEGKPAHAFALSSTALLHPWLRPPPVALGGCPRYAVVPGGRASLLAFKLGRTPAWIDLLAETGWEFVKFRHLRQLSALPDLTLAGFRARIGLDPILSLQGAQMTLFEEQTRGVSDVA